MEDQNKNFVLRDDRIDWGVSPINGPAAMVFEEAASHKPRSWHTWNQRSALTPKAPAPLDVSPPNAQTHRPPDEIESATLSPVRKNPCKLSQVLSAGTHRAKKRFGEPISEMRGLVYFLFSHTHKSAPTIEKRPNLWDLMDRNYTD